MTGPTSNTGNPTTDHDEIRQWAEARGGKPAAVEGTERGGDDVGLIRLEFPDAPHADDSKLTEISWDEFFEKFDASGLALIYQEHTAGGQLSNFNKLVKQETAAASMTDEQRSATLAKSTGKKTAPKTATAKKAVAKKAPAPTAKKTAKKAPVPTAKTSAAKKGATKKVPAAKKAVAKKTPAAKKAVAKKSAKKVPASRGFRGR